MAEAVVAAGAIPAEAAEGEEAAAVVVARPTAAEAAEGRAAAEGAARASPCWSQVPQ